MASIPKFSKLDTDFIAKRNAFFESNPVDAKFAVDNWSLFLGTVPMGTFLARYELLKKIVDVPGHVLEFGVFNGSNLLFMAKILRLLAPHDLRKLYGFDTFEGLQEFNSKDGIAVEDRGRYRGRRELLERSIALHGFEDSIELVAGKIEDTLHEFLKTNAHHLYSFVYLDTDLYQSTQLVLSEVWPRLSPGGIIALDEGYHDRFPGEGIAAQEFLAAHQGQCNVGAIPFARQPMFYIQKR
ncbi:TylF/MycF family methyltransferase [Pendulispora brunnea]|uniref:TylF/MycF family methyltransferase n=1 Tax=Pendulispora brunnea TaxID=2905690 RepID=A0ABZ2KCE5_9BACT